MSALRCLGVAAILISSIAAAEEPKAKTVEELAKDLKPSIVVITAKGREANKDHLGTGFIVDANGTIATNFHVIGEGRPIAVEFSNGKKFDVVSVLAVDRVRDLAIIKIDAKDLPALPLGDADKLKDGQQVVALGNPQGLRHSVTAGVVSGRREIDSQSMIQLAIPLEPGNSGGPVVDMQGRVQGIITLKSTVTENLGFAAPVNSLKPLIAKPQPIKMDAWITIGSLDPDEWKPQMGSSWRQRAGRIKVEGVGSGFGGRSVCIYQNKPPALPYEIAVTVKLNDERGAAGLIFHDDGERHYGFYPTGGKFRLTRFDGADVFSWKILEDVHSPHYKPGEWNSIKVRVSKDGVQCFVNDQLTIDSKDVEITKGQPGLAKFRDTVAEFRNFQVAKKIESRSMSSEEAAKLLKPLDALTGKKNVPSEIIQTLAKAKNSGDVLRERAKELERQAVQLRELASKANERRIFDQIVEILSPDEAKIDLIHAALLLAKLDNEDVDVEAYRADFDRLAKRLIASLPKKADDKAKLAALNKFFYEQRGFHGSRSDYYNRSNSYLNEVLDDREGIPITLSLVYMELGKRIGLNLEGIGMPGHFVVRQVLKKGDGPFIDVFERGETFDLEEAKKRVESRGIKFRDEHVAPIAKKAIVVRMMHNLFRVARDEADMDAGLRYLNGIVMLDPDSLEDRFSRSMFLYNKGLKKEALEDVKYLLDHAPEGVERRKLEQLKQTLEREVGDN